MKKIYLMFNRVTFIGTISIMLLFVSESFAQLPYVVVDGDTLLISELTSFPYWLNSGQTIKPGNKVVNISGLQYNVAPSVSGGNSLQFESVISVVSQQTVPSNKVWKIESVGLNLTAGTIGVTGPTGPAGVAGATGLTGSFPSGNASGDIQYWDGAQWTMVPAGNYGQLLAICNGVPSWGGCPPLVTTTSASSIAGTSAITGGEVTLDGGTSVTNRGVCYNTSPNPTTANSIKAVGSGTGVFTANLTCLLPGTTYYVRAYAINSVGTSYGNEINFTTASYPLIGDCYGGGIVFYVDGTGQHGLIASVSDQSSGVAWGCDGTTIPGADGLVIGTGIQNTADIVAGCSTVGIPAYLCNTLILNGYSDWFLPSRDELIQMYQQKTVIGGFSSSEYWSSSEYNSNFAYYVTFSNGSSGSDNKYSGHKVRAIRAY